MRPLVRNIGDKIEILATDFPCILFDYSAAENLGRVTELVSQFEFRYLFFPKVLFFCFSIISPVFKVKLLWRHFCSQHDANTI